MVLFGFWLGMAVPVPAAVPGLGDLDGDGRVTVLDVVRLAKLLGEVDGGVGLETRAAADVNQDGALNGTDVALAAALAASSRQASALPLLTVRSTSPASGEDSVSVYRETVFRLSQPLAADAVVDSSRLRAFLGERGLLGRAEVASDRRSVTLFHLEPLPAQARIRVLLDGNGWLDAWGRPVDLDGDGVAGGVRVLEFDTLNLTPLEGTSVVGRVFASQPGEGEGGGTLDLPLAGVTITVDGREETLRAVTDGGGNFRLSPAPSGAFFVHIDGRTVTNLAGGVRYPDQAYFPYVGKVWRAVAGRESNIGDVFLPRVAAGTLQPTGLTTSTTVTFPASVIAEDPRLAGVSMEVPAGALFREDGTRGGRVGLAPVAPDRLPEPLPPGMNPALVITIQTDGPSNFDRPVPVCFPNLPEPGTGRVLVPGEKTALWSFNHDTGRFEMAGSMSVTPDGRLACTDPGVGIPAPGWHFVWPGTNARGGGSECQTYGPASPYEPGTRSRPAGRPSNDPCRPARSAGSGGTAGDPIQLFSGEMIEEITDLRIPGRGFDFEWRRTYRSRSGQLTAQGHGWDHPYQVVLEAAGEDLVLREGTGRVDRYTRGTRQVWTRAEFLREITRTPEGGYVLTFEDRGQWFFYPLDGSPRAGRLASSADRNGNRMTFGYDGRGRLERIFDTLDREIRVGHNGDGFIESITDFAGRTVRYRYYQDGDIGGGFGDLKSVSSPPVNGTPTGNDYPEGKTVSYTYSTGYADPRLNHNLLTITDGRRNDPGDPTFGKGPYLENIYSSAVDEADPTFDRVVRQVWGDGVLDFDYAPILPGSRNGFAVGRTLVNDRVGNVSEHFFDAGNRLVRVRQYAGRAVPDRPTTALDNRPQGRLRAEDPDYFETRYEWTNDSLQRRVIHPNGNITEYVYEADLNPLASALARGNMRRVRHLPGTHQPAGDQEVIEESYEYDTGAGAGCCGFGFITLMRDGRGQVTRHEYDARGNRVRTRHALPQAVLEWEYNTFGQLTARVLPPDASGHRRRDELEYHADGPQRGYLRREIVDANGLRLSTTFEYDAVGEVVRLIDPAGRDTRRVVNALGQAVRVFSPEVTPGGGIRYQRDYFYDANNNPIRVEVSNQDEAGRLRDNVSYTTRFEYDRLNRPVRVSQEIEAERTAVTEYAYDANGNRIRVRQPEAVAGRQPAGVVEIRFDERDLPFQVIGAPGDPAQSTTQSDYDLNGNLVRSREGLEANPRESRFVYDGYDRLVNTTDPMGNESRRHYDAAGNLVRMVLEGELEDRPGEGQRVRLGEVRREFDALNRLVRVDEAHLDPATQTAVGDGWQSTALEYSPASQLVRRVNDRGHAISMVHDTAGRVLEARDARGNRLRRNYDTAGNAVEITRYEISDLDATEGVSTTRMAFDGLDRMVRRTDAAGNVLEFAYDSRGHAVLERDAARATPDSPGNPVRRVFDGLDRLIEERRVLTDSGNGPGQVIGEIVVRRHWDDNSRLTGVTDGNGRLTQFEYDSLDRLIRKTGPDGLAMTLTYNVHSDVTMMTEPRGTTIRQTFDALGRLVRRDIVPGDGVDVATTFEERVYDGRSRLVRGGNDATRLELGHDSLGNLTLDSVNGRAVRVTHDGSGNPRRILYPGGRTLEAEYDVLNQLTSIVDVTQGPAVMMVRHHYAGPGRLARREYGNGLRWDLGYDLAKRPVRSTHRTQTGQVLEDRAYTWDSNHLKSQDRDLRPGGLGQEFQYDAAHRLQTVVTTGVLVETRTYRWDGAGNRLAVEGDGDAGAYVLAGAPSNDAVLNQYTRTPFDERSYDAGGNLVEIKEASSEVSRLKFDYLNRLVGVEAGGRSVRYHLDILGRRVERVEGENDVVRYAYLGGQRIEEQDRSGTVLATYVYGLGLNEVVSMRRNGADIWFHGDPQQSIRMATSGQGAVVERYQYDEFGNPALFDAEGRSIPASAVGNPFLFTGHIFDEESGLYHARHRSYDPRAGRFISRDPAGAWTDPYAAGNAYTYAGNNPATFVDPLGLAATRPRPEEFVAPGLNAPAAVLLSQSRNMAAQAARLLGEAEQINSAMAKELLDWTDDFLRGAVQLEGEGGKLVRVMAESTDEAVSLVNSMYGSGRINPLRGPKDWDRFFSEMGSMARQSHWYADTTDQLADMEARAARMAQRGSRLAQAGKLLGGAGIALETGLAAYDNYRNCADAVTSVNDTVGTAAASGLVLAAPPLAVVDLVTGGAVTGSIHNALITPVTTARVVFGDVNGRDARAIKSTYTRFAVGRWAWSAGEWLADKLID